MILKERLNAVWNTHGVACPNHLVRWNEEGKGHLKFSKYRLYYNKGTLRKPKGKKPKGKGFTWLCKLYQLAWRVVK